MKRSTKILALCALALSVLVFTAAKKNKAVTFHGNPDEKWLIAYIYHPNELPDPTYLTHINYAFGHVNDSFDGVRIEQEEWFTKIAKLKRKYPHLKVILSIGGWGSGNFSEMAADSLKRLSFAKDCKRIVDKYKIDGIDIDWEYPGTSVAKISSSPDDVKNYTKMMRDIRAAIGWDKILSHATDGGGVHIDYAEVDKYMSYTNVMSYDLGGGEYHRSPLYGSERMLQPGSICQDSCIKAHLKAGIPPEKLVMGLTFGGVRGADPTKAHLLEGYTYHWDEEAQEPYLVNDKTGRRMPFVDEKSAYNKAKYILSKGLRGAMYWEYKSDTPDGAYRRTVYRALNDTSFFLGTYDNKRMRAPQRRPRPAAPAQP